MHCKVTIKNVKISGKNNVYSLECNKEGNISKLELYLSKTATQEEVKKSIEYLVKRESKTIIGKSFEFDI